MPVLHFGIVGAVMPHKGLHVAAEAFRNIDPNKATLHAWGSGPDEYADELRDVIALEGPFADEEKAQVFASMDVLLVPSVGLESFGLAAREAMRYGVPVIAANDGALRELQCAAHFPSGDAAALERIVRGVIEHPEILDQWRAAIVPPKTIDAHAAEIESVYERVLA